MRIAVLALESVFDTGLAVVLDAFSTANELNALHECAAAPFELSTVGVARRVHTGQGLRLETEHWTACSRPDWVIVPAIAYKMPGPLADALAQPNIRMSGRALRGWAEGGTRVGAACIGTFVLAESGLLDGHEATTTWWLAPVFRQRYPRVKLSDGPMIVHSDTFVTAGAALSHMDLALWIIRQASPELAELVARYLIVDSRPTQMAYAISDHLAHNDPLIQKFDRYVRDSIGRPFDLTNAARALATSKRTLARRVQDVLGKSPLSYVQDLRVQRAVHLLKTTSQSVDRIAEQVGYSDGVTLRSLLRRRLGRGLRQIRNG